MSALTAGRNTVRKTPDTLYLPMAAGAVIYAGSIVCVDADGYAVPGADTADYSVAGICKDDPANPGVGSFDNSGGDDGDAHVCVWRVGRFRLDCHRTPTQDMLGACVYVVDDQTVTPHEWDVDNDVLFGVITALPGTTLALDPHAQFGTDEVEVEMVPGCREWTGDLTTTTEAPTTTTTTAQG